MDLVALWRVGSFHIGDRTHVSCIGRQILIHWATGVAQRWFFFFFFSICGIYILCIEWGFIFLSNYLDFYFLHLLRKPPDSLLPTPSTECVSCSALCSPMGYSSPGCSVQRIFQARILEWITISFSWGTSLPRDWTQVSCIAGRSLSIWATREAPNTEGHSKCQNISWIIKLIPKNWETLSDNRSYRFKKYPSCY